MNARVANMQKKRKTLGITEEVEPYTQLNQEDIKKMEETTNVFKQLFEKKYYFLHNVKKMLMHFQKMINIFLNQDKLKQVNPRIIVLCQYI